MRAAALLTGRGDRNSADDRHGPAPIRAPGRVVLRPGSGVPFRFELRSLLRVTAHVPSACVRKARFPRNRRGGADVLLAASLWGTTGTVRTFADGASPYSIAAIRIVVGGLMLLCLAASTRRGAGLRRLLRERRNLPLIGLGAVAISVYQTAFFVAAGRTGVAIGTVVTIGGAPVFAA
ncbi:EamA family transporter [Actinomadura madurae]|uniref:EamA family transporter n=1 Tax=Actinomadura madurae TaxID=1993 RepID=UPI0020D203A4|nr:EamA family transporter [Actinomadura madurae]MCQ0020307.1 DMT family transporter [Actinomadura madurae]